MVLTADYWLTISSMYWTVHLLWENITPQCMITMPALSTGTLGRSSDEVKVLRFLMPRNTKKLNLCTARDPYAAEGCLRELHLLNLPP